MLMLAGCATGSHLGGEESLPAKVVRLKGAARWSSDDDKAWREIKVGSNLLPGVLVQTAAASRMDIGLGESGNPSPRAGWDKGMLYKPDTHPANLVRVWENSMLGLDRLTRKLTRVGTHLTEDMQFDLRAGHIFVHQMKMAGDSEYEIKFPKGIVRIQDGIYDVSAEGVVKVLVGKASVTVAGSSGTQEVLAGQVFDARTGVTRSLGAYLNR
jgi:hypothetical protein